MATRSGSMAYMEANHPHTFYEYNALDVANTWAIKDIQLAQIVNDPEALRLNQFLLRASDMLMQVEKEGILIDVNELEELDLEYQEKLAFIRHKFVLWLKEFMPNFMLVDAKGKGVKFNPRSWQHVQKVLLELGIQTYSTDAEHIQRIVDSPRAKHAHAFCHRLLEFRREDKLYGTYIQGIRKRLFRDRIHTTFFLHGTTTGRLSSRNPNLQNIPRGPNIKRMFIPANGNAFIQADFSQIEYRTVACLAQETILQEIFGDSERDVFGEFANEIFGGCWTKADFKEWGTVPYIYRQVVKRIIHGSNYGMWPKTLTEQVNSDIIKLSEQTGNDELANYQFQVAQGKVFQNHYKRLVPNLVKWQSDTISEIHSYGELSTPFGRKRRFPLITNENKKDIEKEGLAFKPQSISSDICLRAGMYLRKRLRKGSSIRLFVHDSIMVECPIVNIEEVSSLMHECMMQSGKEFSDYVPFAVDIKSSEKSWAEV